MTTGTDELLLGGIKPRFIVHVTSSGATYRTADGPSSAHDFVTALHAAAIYRSPVAAIVAGCAGAALLALLIHPALSVAVIAAGAIAAAIASAGAKRRQTVSVVYHLDATAAAAAQGVANAVASLAGSAALWRIGPSRLRANVVQSAPPYLVANVSAASIVAGSESLLFLPDGVVVRDAQGTFSHIRYATVKAESDVTRHTEWSSVPSDCRVVGSVWQYANKNGSPDRRRTNNRQIPVVLYGGIEISWRGAGWSLLASNVDVASQFADSLQKAIASPAPKPIAVAAAPAPVRPPVVPLSATPPVPKPVQPPPLPPPPSPKPVVAAPAPKPIAAPRPAAPQPVARQGLTELERVLQASIDLKRRLGETPRFTPAMSAPVDAEWIGPGRTANLHGFATGDLVYLGRRLAQLDGSGIEPSLLNPALPIDSAHPNVAGDGVTYWPSYHAIPAGARAALLQWLASGRKDPNVYIGYVFIFFYGLERRVCEFLRGRVSDRDEILAIAREVARLLDVYEERSNSFAGYAGAFLDFLGGIEPRARELRRTPADPADGPSLRLKLALGQLAAASKPVPAGLALEWVRATQYLNTPATRCSDEFELLFHIRYAKNFGDGIVVKPNKTPLQIEYRPASAALDSIVYRNKDFPDVTVLARPLEKFLALAYECSSALDPFSRFLGKNPEARGSLAAFGLLPHELVEATPSADAQSLASLVTSRLDGNGAATLGAGELFQFVPLAKPGKVSKNEATLLAQALEKLGYGIEPDVRLGGPVPDLDGRVIVFRRLPDCPSTASDEYDAATLLVRLGVMVSAANDSVSSAERELLERHIQDVLQLSSGERQRLTMHLAWLVETDLGMTGLKRRIEELPSDTRRAIGKLLIDVAVTDGNVDAREMKMLEKLYAALDLPSGDLYRDVHAAHATDDEPVVVDVPAATPKAFRIPSKPAPATTASGLDMSRVRMKIAETREVSALLGSIFTEDETPAAQAPAAAEAGTVGTLDAAHSELLRRLAAREIWPRDEVERVASELSLLTDGALETINDYAYATANDAFWEDHDPLAINSRVATELMA